MDGGPICNLVDCVNISDNGLQVKDVWQANSWNLDFLYTVLPYHIKHKVLGAPFVANFDIEDCIIWSASSTGDYTAKSAYLWLTNNSRVDFPMIS